MHWTHDIDEDMVLAARALIYGLLQRVFSEIPDSLLSEQERSEIVIEALGVYRDIALLIGKHEDAAALSPDRAPSRTTENTLVQPSLEGEYNRLFVGVGKPAVCVWESVYLTGNSSLFQASTLQVRHFYKRFGLQSRDRIHVADDHIAIELAFLRELAIRALDLDGEERCELLQAQRDFLQQHLGRWIISFTDNVMNADKIGYYCDYARLLRSFVAIDQHALTSMCD